MTLRLYLHKPAVVMVAQVDLHGNAAVYPQHEIDFKNVTVGNATLLVPGMTVLYGTAPGKDDLGRNRIARISEDYPTFRTEVGRFSLGHNDGEVELIENSYMTVLMDFRVWAKIPRMIGSVIRKDGTIPAFGYVDKPRPVANAGPGVAGTIDGTGSLTVTFSGSRSFQFDDTLTPPVAGLTTFNWEVGDGTLVTGVLTAAQITVRFPPGFRYVRLLVTAQNGETHTTWVPVFVRDPAADLSTTAFQVKNHTQTLEGQEMAIDFFTPLPRDQFLDGGLMMLWDDAVAYTPTDPDSRRHMLFIGWHQVDEAVVSAQPTAALHSTGLTFGDVCRRLATLPGFPQVQEYNAAPTQWTQTMFPNVLYYIWYLLYWHSTALEVADLIWVGMAQATMALYEYVALGSDRASLYVQVNSLVQMLTPDHRMTCSRQGQICLVVNPQIQNVADRASTGWQTLADGDWSELHYGYARPPKVNQIRTMALVSGRDKILINGKEEIEVIACVTPGEAHGQGDQDLEVNQRIAWSQDQLNIGEGNRYANMNARYGRFAITLPYEMLVPAFDVAVPFWTRLTVSAANLPEREAVALTNQRGLVMEMSIGYDYQPTALVRTVTLQWEMETSGPKAATVILWPDAPDEAFLLRHAAALQGVEE